MVSIELLLLEMYTKLKELNTKTDEISIKLEALDTENKDIQEYLGLEMSEYDMSIDDIERFKEEWDEARFRIRGKHWGIMNKRAKNIRTPIDYPEWFTSSPYSSELPEYSFMTPEEIENRDSLIYEWDRIRFQFVKIARDRNKVPHKPSWGEDLSKLRCPSVSYIPLSQAILEGSKKHEDDEVRAERNAQREHRRIMIDVFALESSAFELGLGYDTYDQMKSLIDEITNWLLVNVGYGVHVGKFRVAEYAEILQERIYDLEYQTYITKTEIRKLTHDIDHLAFRICTYFGCYFEDIKPLLGHDVKTLWEEFRYRGTGAYVNSGCIFRGEIDYYEDNSGLIKEELEYDPELDEEIDWAEWDDFEDML